MIVCICHRVSDADIHRVVHAGCRSFEDLQDALRVATGCGACTCCAEELFNAQVVACTAACSGTPLAACKATSSSKLSLSRSCHSGPSAMS
jgi:bacterioferritin-associated ferredoxin